MAYDSQPSNYGKNKGRSVGFWNKPKARVVEDVKSAPTAKKRDFVLIRKLMRAIHNVEIMVTM